MTLAEMLARLAEVKRLMVAIADGAKSANRDLTETEGAEFDTLEAEANDLKAQIAAAEETRKRNEARLSRAAGLSAEIGQQSGGRRTSPGTPGAHSGTVEVGKNLQQDDPKKGFSSPREFLMSVMNHTIKGQTDERLRLLATAGSDEQSTFNDQYGGFLIPEGIAPGILMTSPASDPMGALTTKVPMAQRKLAFNVADDKNQVPSVAAGLLVYRRAEAASVTSSRAKFKQLSIEATALMGVAYATEEILIESPISFASILSQGFDKAFASRIIEERLNGTGVGQFLGVNNAPCKIDVAKESGQVAGTIVYQNLIKMVARLWEGASNPIWLVNKTTLPQLMQMAITIGTGGVPAWQFNAREGVAGTLLGYPVVTSEYCSAVGTVGDILLCDWSQYLDGVYQPMQSAESVHVRFETHERAFKFWMDNGGAPSWLDVYTPKRGDTMAPFVRLATRA